MIFQYCESYLFLSILFVIIAVTFQSDDGETNVSYTECHWDSFNTCSKRECSVRCSGYFGFWDKVSNKLICYHNHADSKPINRITESCVCGYMPIKGRRYAVPCTPKKEFKDTTNIRHCKRKCGKIRLYKYLTERSVKVSYCDDSNKTIPHKLEMLPRDKKNDRYVGTSYPCRCAVRSVLLNIADSTAEKPEEYNREIEPEFSNMCQMGEFKQTHKMRCTLTCNTAKAFIPQNSAELVCYHRLWITEAIPSGETCQCGIIVKNKSGNSSVHKCVPEMIHPTISANSSSCTDVCKSATAFVFRTIPHIRITHCEPFNQEPIKTFDKILEAKIGLHQLVTTTDGKKKSEYACECGLDPLLPMDLNRNEVTSSPYLGYTNAQCSKSRGENSKRCVPMRRIERSGNKRGRPSNEVIIRSQPVGDFGMPSSFYEPEMESFEFSISVNDIMELNADAMSPRGMCNESERQGEQAQRENEDNVFRNQTTNNGEEREQNADFPDEFTQPVEDLALPFIAVYTPAGNEIGQSSEMKLPALNIPYEISADGEIPASKTESSKFELPDLNIPYEISAEEDIPAINTEPPDLSPARKRMRNS